MAATAHMWAVIRKGQRGDIIMWHSVRRTRVDAISAFMDAYDPHYRSGKWAYHRARDSRVARVIVQEEIA